MADHRGSTACSRRPAVIRLLALGQVLTSAMREQPAACTCGTDPFGNHDPSCPADKPSAAIPSDDRVAEWVEGAQKVLADDLPSGHKLWKPWALDLADQVIALANRLDDAEELARRQAEEIDRWEGMEATRGA